ncbi:biopolymer transport protein ExbD [Runella defluvii]|uniref:Biopolymer transport protein ExbD n=1 Tax=Runella defluvii TaxID=370973 RepID=A0A7W5ZKL7_9BACT|nr:biopolymer transporter ExbD [Runella defluvii]MBB3838598.1 biopolymer transport protein ExbD [Runella defluvii]HAK79338.1 biopolymer transporter ExbD [Runella sp.]HAO51729.1 biopolymer transporter ExbD [Runella sp.]
MKIRRKSKFAPEVFTHSLNDIMFFLMLFFLIISTMVNPNVIKLMLPKASAAQQMQKKQTTVAVDSEKNYFIDRNPVAKDQLETQLAAIFNGVEDKTVILQVDQTVSVQDLVDVLAIGAKLDIKMVMAVKK